MPVSHIQLRTGTSEDYRKAICNSLYRALRDVLRVPDDDQFMTLTEHEGANFRYGHAFGIKRSDSLVYIQITVLDSRTKEQKRALFQRLAELLQESPGIRPQDVFVNIFDCPIENWCVGNGVPLSP